MGFKTRLVTIEEKYFVMEINDISEAFREFCHYHNNMPKIIIIHPKHRDEIIIDFRRQFQSFPNSKENDDIMFMGVKIITSIDIKENKVEIY